MKNTNEHTNDSTKFRDLVSKVTITDDAKPDMAQSILSWVNESKPQVIYKRTK